MNLLVLLFLSGIFLQSNGEENVGDDKIVGGEDAVLGQFPHQVLWTRYGSVMCGGSIYNKSTIITAAHCCKPYEDEDISWSDAAIVGGQIDIDDLSGQTKKIKSYLIHPDYNPTHMVNDICLLTLESDLIFNDNVKNIELNTGDLSAQTKCIVSGWGITSVSHFRF